MWKEQELADMNKNVHEKRSIGHMERAPRPQLDQSCCPDTGNTTKREEEEMERKMKEPWKDKKSPFQALFTSYLSFSKSIRHN